MKVVCPKHVYAHDSGTQCPWCIPTNPIEVPGRLDISLPDQTIMSKGFYYVFRNSSYVPVMVHLRESRSVEAYITDWSGSRLKPATSRVTGTFMEKSFCPVGRYGTWVAYYLGHDGQAWTALMVAETVGDDWIFRVKEIT